MIQNRKKMLLCRLLPNLWMRCRRKRNSATVTMPPSEGSTRFTRRTSPKPTMRYRIPTRSKTVFDISNYGSRRANLAPSLSPPWDRKRNARGENCCTSPTRPTTSRVHWRSIWQNARATTRRTKKQAARASETPKELPVASEKVHVVHEALQKARCVGKETGLMAQSHYQNFRRFAVSGPNQCARTGRDSRRRAVSRLGRLISMSARQHARVGESVTTRACWQRVISSHFAGRPQD